MSIKHCEICKFNPPRSKSSKLCVTCAEGVQRLVYADTQLKADREKYSAGASTTSTRRAASRY